MIKQILSAIHYAHTKGIYHLDLKPENILLQQGSEEKIIIIDFGLNKFIGADNYIDMKMGELR